MDISVDNSRPGVVKRVTRSATGVGSDTARRDPGHLPRFASPRRVRRSESVPERTLDLDARSLRPGAESNPHPADSAPHGARARPCHGGGRPDQVLVGDDTIGVLHERGQHHELEVREMDRLVTDPRLVARQVESEIAGDEDVVVGRVRRGCWHPRRPGSPHFGCGPHAVLSRGRSAVEESHPCVSTVCSQSRWSVKWTRVT